LLPYAGLQRSVWMAVVCNFIVSGAALRRHALERQSERNPADALVTVQQA
jgi:hypothetical protein